MLRLCTMRRIWRMPPAARHRQLFNEKPIKPNERNLFSVRREIKIGPFICANAFLLFSLGAHWCCGERLSRPPLLFSLSHLLAVCEPLNWLKQTSMRALTKRRGLILPFAIQRAHFEMSRQCWGLCLHLHRRLEFSFIQVNASWVVRLKTLRFPL